MQPKEPSLDITQTQLQEAVEDMDPIKSIKNITAAAAEVLAESDLPTKWDDIIGMLDSEDISERIRLSAHIIFRGKLILDEMEFDFANDKWGVKVR